MCGQQGAPRARQQGRPGVCVLWAGFALAFRGFGGVQAGACGSAVCLLAPQGVSILIQRLLPSPPAPLLLLLALLGHRAQGQGAPTGRPHEKGQARHGQGSSTDEGRQGAQDEGRRRCAQEGRQALKDRLSVCLRVVPAVQHLLWKFLVSVVVGTAGGLRLMNVV